MEIIITPHALKRFCFLYEEKFGKLPDNPEEKLKELFLSARKNEVKKSFRIIEIDLKNRKYYPRKYYKCKGWLFVVEWQQGTAFIVTVHDGKMGHWRSAKFFKKKR